MTATTDWKPGPVGFKTFVTPQFGVIVFWLIAVPTLVGAGMLIFQGSVTTGLIAIGAVLFWRMFFETMTIMFAIHGVLIEIRDADKVKMANEERERKLARARELAARNIAKAQPGETRLDSL